MTEDRPYIIMHMVSSIDGRIIPSRWSDHVTSSMGDIYEELHREFGADGWVVGRVTMAEFGKGGQREIRATQRYPRETWRASTADRGPYAIALDRSGKLHLNIDRANGDPIIAVLAESVSDDHLAELRRDDISYVFAGKEELDLALAVRTLQRDFGIRRLLLEGGGGINGSFLGAGLIDEISLLIAPVADGDPTVPTTFDREEAAITAGLELKQVKQLAGDLVHLTYLTKPV